MNPKAIAMGMLVYALIGVAIGLYLYYYNTSVYPLYLSASSCIDNARNIVRGIGAVAMLLAVYEYFAFDIRSGMAATMLSTGFGLKRYVLFKALYLVALGAVLYTPMLILALPFQDFRLVIGGEVASDIALVVGFGLLLSVLSQRVEVVVLGGLAASLVLKFVLTLLGAAKNFWLTPVSSTYFYYWLKRGTMPVQDLALSFLLYSILVSAIILALLVFFSEKIARRGVYSWRP